MSHWPRHKINPRFKGWRRKRHVLTGKESKSQCKGICISNGRNHCRHLTKLPYWPQICKQNSVLGAGRDDFLALRAQDNRKRVKKYANNCNARFEHAEWPKAGMVKGEGSSGQTDPLQLMRAGHQWAGKALLAWFWSMFRTWTCGDGRNYIPVGGKSQVRQIKACLGNPRPLVYLEWGVHEGELQDIRLKR